MAAWLVVGQELDPERITELKAQDEREVAFQRALGLLQYRPRSEAEIRRKLQQSSFSETLIEEILTRLRETGLVNDAGFAQTWVENRSEFKPRGKRALTAELRQRGVAEDTIQAALSDLNEGELAYQAGQKKAARLAGLERAEFRQKMYGFLARRGFGYDVSAEVVDRLWNELQSDGSGSDPDWDEDIE